ncbi:hypothetical protein DSUL_20497 [Desulfovibrionales bacterium]
MARCGVLSIFVDISPRQVTRIFKDYAEHIVCHYLKVIFNTIVNIAVLILVVGNFTEGQQDI